MTTEFGSRSKMVTDPEDKKGKAPVPKFASFKPNASIVPTPGDRARSSRDTKKEDISKDYERAKRFHDDSGRGHKRRQRRSRDRARERDSSRRQDSTRESGPRIPSILQGQEDTSLYKIDTKGDKYNVVYGSLHRYDVPRYYRCGRGRVLGLPPNYKIDRDSEDAKSLLVVPYSRNPESTKLKNKNSFWRLAAKDSRFHLVTQEPDSQADLDLRKDFLPIYRQGSRKRRRVGGATAGFVSNNESGLDYRSIEGRAKPDLDSDITSESDLEPDDESIRRQHAEFSRLVSERPDDVSAWLQLIDHQESLVGKVDRDGHRVLTAAEKRSVADIKLSLYEKSLRKIPTSAPRDRLLLGMMEEGSKIWDTKTLSNKWKETLKSNQGYISLWVKYLNFQQTQFLGFAYEQCKAFFIECLKLNPQNGPSQERHVINIYVLLRLSLFMREAGFAEHAVAIWQSVLEFNFRQPKDIGVETDITAATSSFAQFWESEVPRIGEPGAKGWGTTNNAPAPKSDPQVGDDLDNAVIFESWVQKEQSCACSSQLPARTLDEVREDDPYRVILFSDVADFLMSFSGDGLSDFLINAFLLFCHLPPLPTQTDIKTLSSWRGDPFICNTLLDQADSIVSGWFSSVLHASGPEHHIPPMRSAPESFANVTDTLFGDGKAWFSALETWEQTYAGDRTTINSKWVRQTLQQLVDCLPNNDTLAEFTIALESVCDLKQAKKYAKGLLRKRPSSVRLYNAYALIEARNEQVTTAEQVWMTTLSMSQNFGEESRLDCILLWKSWAWEALRINDERKAIRVLLSISSQNWDRDKFLKSLELEASANAADFLKTQRFLSDVQDHGLTFGKEEAFASSTECLALLTYLFEERDIGRALDVYEAAISRLEAKGLELSTTSELVYQTKARLLYHHATTARLFKPAIVRTELVDSIYRFPQNTILLSVFAWNESRFRIDDRVRSVLRQHTLPAAQRNDFTSTLGSSTLIPHLFSVYTELHRGVSAGSTTNSARAAFEAAVTSDSGRCSAASWKLYVLFELKLGDKARAKDVFYRSVRACPWTKELVLLAFREPGLRDNMNVQELKKVWNVLVEKELRIHVDLEEWFDEHEISRPDMGRAGSQHPIRMPDDQNSDEEMHEG